MEEGELPARRQRVVRMKTVMDINSGRIVDHILWVR